MNSDGRPTLNEFLGSYGSDRRKIIEIDVPDLAGDEMSPFIVLRYGDYTMLLNPMGLKDHLDLDIHPFIDGQPTTAAPWGMSNGRRYALEPTGTTSHGWASTDGVFVLVGKQEGA